MRNFFLIPLFLLVLSGCSSTSSPSNYYWGDYSETLYDVKKYSTEETYRAHEAELLSIIEVSEQKGLRVPPGIYAELGLYALKRDDRAVAENYFALEQQTYPESTLMFENSRNLLF